MPSFYDLLIVQWFQCSKHWDVDKINSWRSLETETLSCIPAPAPDNKTLSGFKSRWQTNFECLSCSKNHSNLISMGSHGLKDPGVFQNEIPKCSDKNYAYMQFKGFQQTNVQSLPPGHKYFTAWQGLGRCSEFIGTA